MKQKAKNDVARLVGANIAARRKQKGMTQAQLGKKLGIGTDSVCRMERGTMAPRFQRLQDIASALDCSIADLFKTREELLQASMLSGSDEPDSLNIPAQIAFLSEKIAQLTRLL